MLTKRSLDPAAPEWETAQALAREALLDRFLGRWAPGFSRRNQQRAELLRDLQLITLVASHVLIHRASPSAPLVALADDEVTMLLFGQWLLDDSTVAAVLERETDRWPKEVSVVCSPKAKRVVKLDLTSHESLPVVWVDGTLSFDPGEIFITSQTPEELGLRALG